MGNLCSKNTKNPDPKLPLENSVVNLTMAENSFDEIYELGKQLGKGSYAVVYEGTKKGTQELYAIKKVARAQLDEEDERAMHEEIDILEMLTHPNIISFYGCFEESDYYYLVTELMAGGELFDRIVKKKNYSEKEAKDVISILLQAINYCHENNVVHRDLKPENLLLVSDDDDETIKLADFGFAERVKGPMTMQCGTPSYVAPEILSHVPYGLPVDMWSAGVICFILLGGYPPFFDDKQFKLVQKIKKGEYKFHQKFWGHISDEAKDLIRKMLDVNPKTRLTAAEALKHPWLGHTDEVLQKRKLDVNHEEFKKFNAKRKLKAAQDAVLFANELNKFKRSSHQAKVKGAADAFSKV